MKPSTTRKKFTSPIFSQLQDLLQDLRRGTKQTRVSNYIILFSQDLDCLQKSTDKAEIQNWSFCHLLFSPELLDSFLGSPKLHTHVLRTNTDQQKSPKQTLKRLPNSCSWNITCTCQCSNLQCFQRYHVAKAERIPVFINWSSMWSSLEEFQNTLKKWDTLGYSDTKFSIALH